MSSTQQPMKALIQCCFVCGDLAAGTRRRIGRPLLPESRKMSVPKPLQKSYTLKGSCKEIMTRGPKKVAYLGLR